MPQTSSRKAQQRRRLQKRRQEGRRRLRASGPGAAGLRPGHTRAVVAAAPVGVSFPPLPLPPALGPVIPGLQGPLNSPPASTLLDPLIPTTADHNTRLG